MLKCFKVPLWERQVISNISYSLGKGERKTEKLNSEHLDVLS